MKAPMDREAIEALGLAICKLVVAHYRARPQCPHTVFEALNAIAIAAAYTLIGTGTDRPRVRQFLIDAIDQQADEIDEQSGMAMLRNAGARAGRT